MRYAERVRRRDRMTKMNAIAIANPAGASPKRAFMILSASGVVVGEWAGVPLWFVGGDAAACWAYCVPMLVLARRVERGHTDR